MIFVFGIKLKVKGAELNEGRTLLSSTQSLGNLLKLVQTTSVQYDNYLTPSSKNKGISVRSGLNKQKISRNNIQMPTRI